jgi:hypothetical protein
LLVATLATVLVANTVHPSRWFSHSGKKEPIGVPIGVPQAAPSATIAAVANNVPRGASSVSQNAPPTVVSTASASAPPQAPVVVAAKPKAAAPPPRATPAVIANSTSPAALAQKVPPAPTVSEKASLGRKGDAPPHVIPPVINHENEQASRPVAVARNSKEPKAEAKEPEAPSEGAAETMSAPPPKTVAGEPAVNRVPEEDEESARSSEVVTEQNQAGTDEALRAEPVNAPEAKRAAPVVGEAKTTARPRRINGMEVRPAEPVANKRVPGLPPRSRRARFLGFDADGQMIFELPSSEEGFAEPRR